MMERNGFEVHEAVEGWREHYQRTCKHWHDRLIANYDAAVSEIGSEKTRLWLIYLAGVSIGFERNTIRIYQTLASSARAGRRAYHQPAPIFIALSPERTEHTRDACLLWSLRTIMPPRAALIIAVRSDAIDGGRRPLPTTSLIG